MSQPKRRANGSSQNTTTISPTKDNTTTTSSSSSSTLPSSRSKFILLSIYPAILLTGSLFSLLDPRARSTPYSTLSQSHPPDLAPSYFARKSNVLNQYFVKILWLWITGSFAAFLLLHPLTGTRLALSRRKLQAVARYVAVTTLWVFTTQWFFGAPLIDRGFRLSGGKCERVLDGKGDIDVVGAFDDDGENPVRELVTAAACKLAGGRWAGGHDISGHVFILILGSAFLGFEVWPVIEMILGRGWAAVEERRSEIQRDGKGEDDVSREKIVVLGSEGDAREWGVSMAIISGVVATAMWMLLMTATYFHTWFEKLTGLLVAFIGIGVVYVLPHYVPVVDSILGRPGR